MSPCSSIVRSVSACSAAAAWSANRSANFATRGRNRHRQLVEIDLPSGPERGYQQFARDRRVDAREVLQGSRIRAVGRPGVQPGQRVDADMRASHRQAGQMIGVVPVPQILEKKDEVGGTVDHPCDIDLWRLHRRAACDISVERELASVSAEHLHGATCFGLGRQLGDERRGHAATYQMHAIQERRESAVLRDSLNAHVCNCSSERRSQPLRSQTLDAGGNFGSRGRHDPTDICRRNASEARCTPGAKRCPT